MKPTATLLGLVFAFTTTLKISEGLQCYNCIYLTTEGKHLGDLECKDGAPQHLVECGEHTEMPRASPDSEESYSLGETFQHLGVQTRSPNKFGCAKIHVDVEVHGYRGTCTLRTCTMNIDTKPGCTNQTNQEWQKNSDIFSKFVHAFTSEAFPHDANIEGCHCDQDKCNVQKKINKTTLPTDSRRSESHFRNSADKIIPLALFMSGVFSILVSF